MKRTIKKRGKNKKQYAMYKGEECLAVGTIEEIARKTNVKKETIYFYTMPTYKKRCKKGKGSRRELVRI